MCGCATMTIVESSTTISCAVAMTSSARPRLRPWLLVRASPIAENVVARAPMLPAGRPAVVVHRKRLLTGQRGCGGLSGYSAGSSRKWVPGANAAAGPCAYAQRMRTDRGRRTFYAAGWVISAGGMLVAVRKWQLHLPEGEQRAEGAERAQGRPA